MHCLVVTIFAVLITILQVLLLFVVVVILLLLLALVYNEFVISYVQYIGKQLVMYIG